MKKQFRSFEEAKKIVHSFGLKNQTQWREYCKYGKLPEGIPKEPSQTYKKEWRGFQNWLGYRKKRELFLPFTEARNYVHELDLGSALEWINYCKSGKVPKDIPKTPYNIYKKEWRGFPDWLGYKKKGELFWSFEKAREYIHTLNLKSQSEWEKYRKSSKRPEEIPTAPVRTYKKEWRGITDWLGYERKIRDSKNLWPFEKARDYVHTLNLKSPRDWYKFKESGKLPKEIPTLPSLSYKNKGWTNWSDWGGYQKKEIWSFEKSKKFVQKLNLKSQTQWRKYCKSGQLPKEIPLYPEFTYKKEWTGFGDWLGTGVIANQNRSFWPYEKSRDYVQKLNLKSYQEWYDFLKTGKLPKEIPSHPERFYKKEWTGFGDWSGTGIISNQNRKFRSFLEARKFIRSLGLKNLKEYHEYCKSGKKPDDIPRAFMHIYKNKGFISVGDFLGTETIAPQKREFWSFEKARNYVQKLELKLFDEWQLYCKSGKLPKEIPTNPNLTYKNKGWKGWGDFLGTGTIASQLKSKEYLPWSEAKILYQKIAKENRITTTIEWRKYVKKNKLPKGLPPLPRTAYSKKNIQNMLEMK